MLIYRDRYNALTLLQGIKLATWALTYKTLVGAWCHRFVGRVCALPSFLVGWRGGVLRGVSPLYRSKVSLIGVRQRAGRRPALPRLTGQLRARVSGVLLGGALIHPQVTGGLVLCYRSSQLRVLEASEVRVRERERGPVDAVIPGSAGGDVEALEGVVGVGGAGRPAAATAVSHRVQRGVVRGQLLCRDGRGDGGGSSCVSTGWRQRARADDKQTSGSHTMTRMNEGDVSPEPLTLIITQMFYISSRRYCEGYASSLHMLFLLRTFSMIDHYTWI